MQLNGQIFLLANGANALNILVHLQLLCAEGFDTSTSIGERLLCNLQFADGIDLMGGSKELQQLTERLEKTAAGYMSDKSKILLNSIKPRPSSNMDECKNAVRNGPVHIPWFHAFHRRNIIKEAKIRLAQAHSAITRLPILWKNNAINFPTKIKLYKSLVLSMLLYGICLVCDWSNREIYPLLLS